MTRFRKRLEDWNTELDRWQETTLGADFPETEAASLWRWFETLSEWGLGR